MIFRHIFFTLSVLLLLTITGTAYSQNNSKCGEGNGVSNGSDTIQTAGTIESVRLQDSMLVVNTPEGKDTIYFTQDTKFALGDPSKVLRPDTRILIYYTTEGDRKVATRIEPAATNENGSENDTTSKDTGAAPPSTPDETPVPGE